MLITREVDYSLRILRALSHGEQVTTGELCESEMIPQQFAYKILRKLSKGGFVVILRGVDGGCRLIADLNAKTLYDLMNSMDALQVVNACTQPGYECSWRQSKGNHCGIHNHLETIQQQVNEGLKSHTLASLFKDDQRVAASGLTP